MTRYAFSDNIKMLGGMNHNLGTTGRQSNCNAKGNPHKKCA